MSGTNDVPDIFVKVFKDFKVLKEAGNLPASLYSRRHRVVG